MAGMTPKERIDTAIRLGRPDRVLSLFVRSFNGFILSSGCTNPMDARPESIKAMLQSVLKFKQPGKPMEMDGDR